jgi:aryl-phospho-beta-D-glucosidase BglC (GH1 family)
MREFTGFKNGVNLGGWLSQCNHTKERYDTFVIEKDFETISKWGMDHVRVPVDYELIQNENGDFKEKGFAYLDRCVEWCRKYHLNMVLDLHKTKGYSFDKGENEQGFFENQGLQERFINLWKKLASRYGKLDEMLAFELLNEVVSPDVAQQWNGIIKRTIQAIRAYSKKIKIIVGGVCNNSVMKVKLLDAPYDENIVYNFHCYEPLIFTHQTAGWVENMPSDFHIAYPNTIEAYEKAGEAINKGFSDCFHVDGVSKIGPEFFEAIFKEAIQKAEENNAMLYCGEYGVIDQADEKSTLLWFHDIHQIFEKYKIGHAIWNYREMNFGICGCHYKTLLDSLKK